MTGRRPLAVGLVGAGPWAWRGHAPALAAGPHTTLAGVWARRTTAADALAARFDAVAYRTLDELIERCEAVAFAVPPDVQAELAIAAAQAGRALLLDKPLAGDLSAARRLASAISEAGVVSQMVLILRYSATVRSFLERTADLGPSGGSARWLSGAQLEPSAATSWRRERGALFDVGPHVIDVLGAALGPVTGVTAGGTLRDSTALLLEHDRGAVSAASMSARVPITPAMVRVEIFGEGGCAVLDGPLVEPQTWSTMLGEFAQAVREGVEHPLDARHGLRLQEIIATAEAQLGTLRP